MTTDLSNFLDTTPSDTPEPELLEEGLYDFQIMNSRSDQVGENQNTKVTVTAKPVSVVEAEFDEEKLGFAVPVRMEFWATENALAHRSPVISLKHFLSRVLDMSADEIADLSYATLLEMAIGQTFRGAVRRNMVGRNKDIPVAEVGRLVG